MTSLRGVRPVLAASVGLAVAAVALTGCGTSGYTVPKSLCGVSVDPHALSSLLPPGRKLTQSADGAETGAGTDTGCYVRVDGKLVMTVGSRLELAENKDVLRDDTKDAGKTSRVGIGNGALVYADGGEALADCAKRSQYQFVTGVLLADRPPRPKGRAEREAAVADILRDLVKHPFAGVCVGDG